MAPFRQAELLEDRRLLTVASAQLLADINSTLLPASESFEPTGLLAKADNTLFLNGLREGSGDLWKLTALDQFERVSDVPIGEELLINTLDVNGTLFFTTGGSNAVLWKSDGTEAGTVQVKAFPAGGVFPFRDLTNVNGTIFFVGNDGTHGYELWKTDGTEVGTVMVKDIYSAGTDIAHAPRQLTNVNGVLFFQALDNSHGRELWKSDGSEAGTVMVREINPGIPSSTPNYLTNINGIVYFSALGAGGSELWRSDGTEAGTVRVADIFAGTGNSSPALLTAVNGTLFFRATNGTGGVELWKSDGTEAGTIRVKDIFSGSGSSIPDKLTNVNGQLFFTADDGSGGVELWTSDGTLSGTLRVHDIRPGASGSSPRDLVSVGSKLFFTADDGTTGREVWMSDGSAAGTVCVADINPGSATSGPQSLISLDGDLHFVATDGTHGKELWRIDGLLGGAEHGFVPPKTADSAPRNFYSYGGSAFFAASNDTYGRELWRTDGTPEGTFLLADVNSGAGSSNPSLGAELGGLLYFSATDSANNGGLWRTDGTIAGTELVTTSLSFKTISEIFEFNGLLYFGADDGVNGIELWRSDGTATGTYLVKDINLGSGRSRPQSFIEANGTLIFLADDGLHGQELWKTDGTESGTVIVREVFQFSSSYKPYLTNVNGVVYFRANGFTSTTDRELWRTDGTFDGTYRVKDIYAGNAGSNPRSLQNVNGTLFFAADDNISGSEVWKSDGTAAGTVKVTDIPPWSSNTGFTDLTNINGTLYFIAPLTGTGLELWRTDGTATGTYLVKDINPGKSDSSIKDITAFGNHLFFTAVLPGIGRELWQSDGTEAGTVLVRDLMPGSFSSYPKYLAAVNGYLLFQADDPSAGIELFAASFLPPSAPELQTILDQVTVEETSFSVVVQSTDSDTSDVHVFSLGPGAPAGMTILQGPGSRKGTILWEVPEFHLVAENPFSVQVIVTDVTDGGLTAQATFLVTVNEFNHPPVLVPIGHKTIGEGQWNLTVSATDVDAMETLTFSLGAGAPAGMTIAPGPNANEATISWIVLDHTLVTPNPFPLQIIVTDNGIGLLSDSETILVSVVNTPLAAVISGPQVTKPGITETYTLLATDPNAVGFEIDWNGDGTFDQTVLGASGTQVTHSFDGPASYNVGLQVTNQTAETSPLFVLPVHVWQGVALVGANVEWVGSDGADSVEFYENGPGEVEVRTLKVGGIVTNYVDSFTGVTGRVIARGNDGNDSLNAAALTSIPATLEGGKHHDTLTGGAANDVLRGEYVGAKADGAEGNDSIIGGGGNDIIEGDGLEGGKDTIRGGTGNDSITGDGGDGLEGRADSVFGEDGDDTIFGNHGHDRLDGGNDNDVITGGDGGESYDIITGGAGNDSLSGGLARDLLIGGLGLDTLNGEGGDDLLVADQTSFDLNAAALLAIQKEWISEDPYDERVAHLSGTAGGVNGTTFVQPGTTVFDDEEVDHLTGGTDMDWFLYNLMQDVLHDHELLEVETDTFGTPLE